MDGERSILLVEKNMKANGVMGKWKERAPTTTHLGILILASGRTIRRMDKGRISIHLGKNMKVSGRMIKNMAKEYQ